MNDTHIKLFSIGFTKKSAEYFFETLRSAGIKRIVDVRLNNVSQLAGFSKKNDLKYFLRKIAGIDYVHLPELAPTRDILDAYRKRKWPWDDYERAFLELIRQRQIEATLSKELLNESCLLCSEDQPHHCHRRLVADYLKEKWQQVEVEHLI